MIVEVKTDCLKLPLLLCSPQFALGFCSAPVFVRKHGDAAHPPPRTRRVHGACWSDPLPCSTESPSRLWGMRGDKILPQVPAKAAEKQALQVEAHLTPVFTILSEHRKLPREKENVTTQLLTSLRLPGRRTPTRCSRISRKSLKKLGRLARRYAPLVKPEATEEIIAIAHDYLNQRGGAEACCPGNDVRSRMHQIYDSVRPGGYLPEFKGREDHYQPG